MLTTHAHRAYQHLRNKLISGDFSPGARIRYGPLGKELGISATPVREAIGKLASEGFVELVPQLGAVVRQLSSKEAIDLFEMRSSLEPFATAKIAQCRSDVLITELEEEINRLEQAAETIESASRKSERTKAIKKFDAADLAFHMLIIEGTGNQQMVKTVGASHILTRIFSSTRHTHDPPVLKQTCDEHQLILDGIINQESEHAATAMFVHIDNSLKLTLLQHEKSDTDRWWE